MRRLCRMFALVAAITAAVQFVGTAVHAQVLIPFGESAGNWDYLMTVSAGSAADPTVDPNFEFGGIPLWTINDYNATTVAAQIFPGGGPATLTWQRGPQPFVYGSVETITTYLNANPGETGTALTAPPSGQRYTQYFRYEFTTNEDFSSLFATASIDDGAALYIDGIEVGRLAECCPDNPVGSPIPYNQNMPTDSPENTNYTATLDLTAFPNGALPAGAHTLGVAVFTVNQTSSDLAMNLELRAFAGENQLAEGATGSLNSAGNWSHLVVPRGVDAEMVMNNDAGGSLYFNSTFELGHISMDNANGYTIMGNGELLFDVSDGETATWNVDSGSHDVQIQVRYADPGTIDVAAGATLTINNDFLTGGNAVTKTGAGELVLNNYVEGDVAMAAGSASGSGQVGGDLHNEGATVSPGDGVGAMSVDGNYVQGPNGALSIEIAGSNSGQFDVMEVLGVMDLDGMLHVSLLDGYDPQIGESFGILSFGSLNGQFQQLDLPQLSSGKAWDISGLYSAGTLSVVPEPGTCLLGGFAAALLLGWARRRR